MTRHVRNVAALVAVAALPVAAALAVKPVPYSSYNDGKSGVSIQTGNKSTISTFSGSCPGGSDPKWVFAIQHTVKVKKSGKFHLDRKTDVTNVQSGKTVHKKRVVVNGRFVTKKKAKGTYKLHLKGCKKTKFKAILDYTAPPQGG